MSLKPIRNPEGVPLYCGPAAVCGITGRRAHVVLKAIWSGLDKCSRSQIGSWKKIKATWPGDLGYALHSLGWAAGIAFDYSREKTRERPTLAKWLKNKNRSMSDYYLVLVTGHWVAVKGRKFLDSHTGEPVFIRKAPHRRARVTKAYRVWKR